MGQRQSKRLSNNSTTPLNVHIDISPPVDNIATPAPPRPLYRLSELIDPVELARQESQALGGPSAHLSPSIDVPGRPIVQSPSGRILNAEAFAAHEDRPLSVRERREEIVRRTMAAVERVETPGAERVFARSRFFQSESALDAQAGEVAEPVQGKKKKRRGGWFCCCC